MAGEPKRRHSKARKRTRRASIMLEKINLIECSNCKKPTVPHVVCKECGFYGGKEVSKQKKVTVTKV